MSIWFSRFIRARTLELKHRQKKLKIGYMSSAYLSKFGMYNTVYDYVDLYNVSVDDFTYIAHGSAISNTSIGKFCSIGPQCKIGLGKHPSSIFVSTHPAFFSTSKQAQVSFVDANSFVEFDEITIGNDVWIGERTMVLDGVSIGNGAIVAAGSIVTKNVLPYSVVAGSPARHIRFRFSEEEISFLQDNQWWDFDLNFLQCNAKYMQSIDGFKVLMSNQ